MIRTYQLATFCFFITTLMYVSKARELKDETIVLRHEKQLNDSLCIWKSERLLNYTLISLEQAKIINKFQSSRNEKLNNKKLRDLQQKLN
jgi:hypothetical protein